MPLPPVVPALDALFPAKEELTKFGVCHDSSSLADDSPQWRWLRDITPRFMYRRSVGVWMKKNAQYDLHGHRSHPWTTKALTAQNWAEWKPLRIGLSMRPGIAMTLSETALHALFRVWESYGLGTAVAPQWTGPGCAGRSGGHGKGHGPQFFFKNVESVSDNWYDASDATNYNASPPSMVEVGGTISSGGRSKKSSMEEAPAAVAPPTTLPNAATSTSSMMAHGGSPHAIDTHAIGTPMESDPKHRSQSGKAKQFPQPMFGVKEELRDDMNTDDGTWWENSNAWFTPDHGDLESENPVVDEAERSTSPF